MSFTSEIWKRIQQNALSIILVMVFIFFFFIFMGIPINEEKKNYTNVQEIYFADDITESHQKIIKRFNEIFEGRIKVIPINLPFTKFTTNERKELLARAFRSKSDKIDILAVDLIWVPRFAKWAEPLNAFFDKDKRDEILDYALESCLFENDLVAMPLKIDLGTMYYRKDLLKGIKGFETIKQKLEKSISWEDFIELKKQIGQTHKPFYIFQAKSYEGLVCSFMESILNQDRHFFENEEYKFASPVPRKVLGLLHDLIYKYEMTPKVVTSYSELQSCNHYVSTDGFFIRYWPEFLSDYNSYYRDSTKNLEFERVPLPHFKGFKNASIFGGWNLMISKFSDNKDAALEFLRFVISEEAQKILMEKGDALPVTKYFYENSQKYSKHAVLDFYRELFYSGVHRPYSEDYTRISDIVAYYVNKTLKNEISVDLALEKMDELIASGEVIIK